MDELFAGLAQHVWPAIQQAGVLGSLVCGLLLYVDRRDSRKTIAEKDAEIKALNKALIDQAMKLAPLVQRNAELIKAAGEAIYKVLKPGRRG